MWLQTRHLVEVLSALSGLTLTLVIGSFAKRLLTTRLPPAKLHPPQVEPEDWQRATSIEMFLPNAMLGIAEQVFFFACFWMAAYFAIAGYLAFKVASKWATWEHITKVPESLGDLSVKERIQYLAARNEWGTRILWRFVFGTLYNALAGVAGSVLARMLEQPCIHVP